MGEVHEESSGVSRGTDLIKADHASWFTSEFLIQRALSLNEGRNSFALEY